MKQVHSRSEKQALTTRLRKIKGQVEAVEKMVEADANCADILMQVIVTRRELKLFVEKVLNAYIRVCIENIASQSQSHCDLRSLTSVLERYIA